MVNRVVITGLGVITPIGHDLDTYWNGLLAGKSGAAPITKFPGIAQLHEPTAGLRVCGVFPHSLTQFRRDYTIPGRVSGPVRRGLSGQTHLNRT